MRKLTLAVGSALTALLVTPLALIAPQPAWSQALEEITVTARKTTESLQEIPMAITAISAEEIDRLGLKDLNQITQQDTSVQFDQGFTPSDTRITIRGLSPTRGRPNAATLVDGIDVSSEAVSNAGGSLLINPRLVDVERIEIVKGPQSALYGRSAFAGAIQYVTKDPGDVFETDIFVDVATEEQLELRGNMSIPITDSLGVLANALVYDQRGIYKNLATDDYLGAANGFGTAITVKWEPTDTVGVKWRTEYSHDEFAPPAQVLLTDFNYFVDVGDSGVFQPGDRVWGTNLAPNSSKCNLGGSGSLPIDPSDGGGVTDGLPGPLNDPGCVSQYEWRASTQALELRAAGANLLTTYMNNALANSPDGQTVQSMAPGIPAFNGCLPGSGCESGYTGKINLGQWDPALSTRDANIWNKQVSETFIGTIPDGDVLGRPAIAPNYQTGPGAADPSQAVDYEGTVKDVFRTSLVVDWGINDALTFTSLTGYTDADVTINQDISKRWEDNCGADVNYLKTVDDPLSMVGGGAATQSMYDYLQGQGLSDADMAPYAPCTSPIADGVNDLGGLFAEDSDTGTIQFSQELRLAWQINDNINFTQGLQYWSEEVDVFDVNQTLIGAGTQCYSNGSGSDLSYQQQGAPPFTPYNSGTFELNPMQLACGKTGVQVAHWADEAFAGRQRVPTNTKRETDHYSWYGALDFNVTDKLSLRLEGRYSREDNSITSAVVTPCFDGASYYNINVDPTNLQDESDPSYWKDGDPTNRTPENSVTGWDYAQNQPKISGCSNGGDNAPSRQPRGTTTANAGQGTGPSAVIICGQTGRCDNLAQSRSGSAAFMWSPNWTYGPDAANQTPGYLNANGGTGADNSYWAWGFEPSPRNPGQLDRTDKYWAPKFTTEYAFTNDIMGYMSWSRGIKPGGFSLLTSGAFGLDAQLDGEYDEVEFDPERLDVWEVGTKSTMADGRIRLNGSIFFQDFKDKQVTVQVVTDGTTGTEVKNISGSEVKGLEMDLTWLATDHLRFQAGYTFLDSQYTDYTIITQSVGDISRIAAGNGDDCSEVAEVPGSTDTNKQFGCVMSFNGNNLERAPRHAFLLNANYTAPLFDTRMEWYTEANYRYQDERHVEAFNAVQFPAYSLTDIRFGLLADNWDVQLYVNNVFEELAVLSGGSNPGIATGDFNIGLANRSGQGALGTPAPGVVAGPTLTNDIYANLPNPRIIGLRASYHFGQ